MYGVPIERWGGCVKRREDTQWERRVLACACKVHALVPSARSHRRGGASWATWAGFQGDLTTVALNPRLSNSTPLEHVTCHRRPICMRVYDDREALTPRGHAFFSACARSLRQHTACGDARAELAPSTGAWRHQGQFLPRSDPDVHGLCKQGPRAIIGRHRWLARRAFVAPRHATDQKPSNGRPACRDPAKVSRAR